MKILQLLLQLPIEPGITVPACYQLVTNQRDILMKILQLLLQLPGLRIQWIRSIFIESGSGSSKKSQSGSGSRKALNPDPDPSFFFTLPI